MTDRPAEHPDPEPPAAPAPAAGGSTPLDLPAPPPAAPAWHEPPAPVPPPGYGPPPPPPRTAPHPAYPQDAPLNPQQERTWAWVSHLSALLALVTGLNFIGPLVTYLAFKDRSQFVREHAAESLNFQITTIIAGFVSVVLIPLFGLGVLLFLIVFIGWLILTVMATIAANNGQRFRYPVNLRLVK